VEEKPTGEFSVSGGFSTAQGFLSEVSVADRNLMGRGQFAKASVSYGQYQKGATLSFVEPYLLGYRMAGGVDLFWQQNLPSSFVSYGTQSVGTNLRLGFALTEELSLQPHYSIYQQSINLSSQFNNCVDTHAAIDFRNGVGPGVLPSNSCYADGEASLPVRKELAAGPVLVSLGGYTLAYNALDNNTSPTSGFYGKLTQDVAGLGGDVNFVRNSADTRNYYELLPDVVGLLHLQAGQIASWGGKDLRMLDHFQMGPNLVRGFAPNGIGPRDLTPGTTNDALGGSMYWGASVEAMTPLYFLPKEVGIKLGVFADAGSLWSYKGATSWNMTGETVQTGLDKFSDIRSAAGVSLIWDSPLGPLRFDLAYPIKKYCATGSSGNQVCDQTQVFRFSGGTKF
jgi:outer membrane protein insertion porin family